MHNFTLEPVAPLGNYRHEFNDSVLAEADEIDVVAVSGPRDQSANNHMILTDSLGLEIPDYQYYSGSLSSGLMVMRSTSEQFYVIRTPECAMSKAQIIDALSPKLYVTDQSDAWAKLSLSGSLAIPALERCSPVDISCAQFKQNSVASTLVEHLSVIILRTDTSDNSYLLLSGSSSAKSFLHAIELSLKFVQ